MAKSWTSPERAGAPGAHGDSWNDFWGDAAQSSQHGGRARSPGRPTEVLISRTEGQVFRERLGFIILCVIGAYCLMRILVELRSILQPFSWALFLVMAWKPVVDGIERRLETLLAASCPGLKHVPRSFGGVQTHNGLRGPCQDGRDSEDELDDEMKSMLGQQDDISSKIGLDSPEIPEVLPQESARPRHSERSSRRSSCQDVDDEDLEVGQEGRSSMRRYIARGTAVVVASMGMLGLLFVFGLMITESFRRMHDHWDVYEKGAQELTKDTVLLFNKVPDSVKKQYQGVTADMVKSFQDVVYGLLGDLVNNISSLILGVLLTMLYTLFWLCSPVPMDSSIDVMFRKYIMFKTLACFGYGICTGLLLWFLCIDLASMFALTTFVLNFVPEVGPFIAMLLPTPLILLDSRLERPCLVLLSALGGQLALKFAFSNIIEIKLIESDKKLRMHPVMILLSVGVFGYLWGPTGMLRQRHA